MAEVLSPPMTPSSTITMLHSRPSSADHQYNQHSPRLGQQQHQKSMSNYGQNTSYRGAPAVQAYAFQKTPTLQSRTSSAPSVPQATGGAQRNGHAQSASTSSSGSSSSPSVKENEQPAPFISWSSDMPDLSLDFNPPPKASPNRYHRPAQRRTDSSVSSQNVPAPQFGGPPSPSISSMSNTQQQSQPTLQRGTSIDDMALAKSKSDFAPQRYKRRSMNNLETQGATSPGQSDPQRPSSGPKTATSTPTTIRPVSSHQRNSSAESQRSQRNASVTSLQKEQSRDSAVSQDDGKIASPRVDAKAVPPRGSSDANKRLNTPSPLSRQTNDIHEQPKQRQAPAAASPAAQHLAAVSDKDLNKGMKSRLRRAFSFGSAQELRKASVQHNMSTQQQGLNQEQAGIEDELDEEQREIAARQEAAGIGAGIYSGQGGFTGSTDNLSISSTASSASMMLRKMGKGVKKGGRSIKGLFRPKSVIGVPAADGPIQLGQGSTVQPTVGGVSMVTVEAERLQQQGATPENLNTTPDPADRPDGTDTFPDLRKAGTTDVSSLRAEPLRASTEGSENSHSQRRSIVGSDKDRAAVLAEVRKGILKRSGTNSPQPSPPVRTESPVSISSTPSTSGNGILNGNKVNTGYFQARPPSRTHSVPVTPNGGLRNISFSPRIQFHDAWSSQEYDRRGEIATCNRLTPMLAQQIKEELNTFKMEMEVHELSKPHTHFF
ncbi:hypothetical protein MBLNU230_g1958t1 [Neophaeotheca triangularis]